MVKVLSSYRLLSLICFLNFLGFAQNPSSQPQNATPVQQGDSLAAIVRTTKAQKTVHAKKVLKIWKPAPVHFLA